MIQFEEAAGLVKDFALQPITQEINYTEALTRVLAENVYSDMDMPPFNKSAMDGFACKRADLSDILTVIETIPAGVTPKKVVNKGECSKIMTGSMLPEGADCVIKVEETETLSANSIRFIADYAHHNICYKGEDLKAGMQVLKKGRLLKPQHIAVLASVGKVKVLVYKFLKAGIISTGDELVEPEKLPGASNIRNSNAWQLMAQAENIGMMATYYGIARDKKDDLLQKITTAEKENDLILLTGGVSMGDFDLVPAVLKEMGFTLIFEKIAVQPGSPTLFAAKGNKRVFGLPGNPVSSYMQFEMLVKLFAWKSCGYDPQPLMIKLPLASAFSRKKAEKLSLIPVRIMDNKVYPLDYHGSAHIHAYTEADGIMSIAAGTFIIKEGETGDVRLI